MSQPAELGLRETLTLLIIIISGKVFLSFPRSLLLLGDSAGWLLILLSGIYSICGCFLIIALIRKYPKVSLFQITRHLTGNYLGAGLNFLFFCYFTINVSLLLRQFAESFILTLLPHTPISVIMVFFLIIMIYSVLLGLETLTRIAWFFGPYLLAGLITIIIFTKPFNFQLLLPLFGAGPLPVLKYSLIQVSSFSEILLVAVISPFFRQPRQIPSTVIWSIVISALIFSGLTAAVTVTFNYIGGAHLAFPVFQLTRLISVGDFIQRVEAAYVFVWFIIAAISMSGLFYGAVMSFGATFRIQNNRPIVFPLAVFLFCLSLIPQSMSQTVGWDTFFIGKFYVAIAFGIPLILWLLSLFQKQKPEVSYE